MSERDEERGFKVEDRRRFDAEGEARERDAAGAKSQMSEAREGVPSGMTFSGFVVGLATQALSFLGADKPDAPAPNVDEAAALIDILSILEEKTQGNLAEDENRLLGEILYDLRLRFVQAKRPKGAGTPDKESS